MWICADLLRLAAVMLALAAAPSHAQADDFDPYVVRGHVVSAQAEDGVKAKEAAISRAMREAMERVLARVTTSADRARLPAPDARGAEALVDRHSVQWETIAPTSYRAAVDVVFSQVAVRGYLTRRGMKAVDIPAPRILVIPVQVESGIPLWWEAAADWRAALERPRFEDGLTPVAFPANSRGDRDEQPARILAADRVTLDTFRVRYQAHSVVVALAETYPGRDRVTVTLTGEDAAGLFEESFDVAGGGLDAAAEAVAERLSDRWKSALSGVSPDGREGGQMAVHVVLNGGEAAWEDIRRRLDASGAISGVAVELMSAMSGNVVIWHAQPADELVARLAAHDLDLFRAGGSWLLQAY